MQRDQPGRSSTDFPASPTRAAASAAARRAAALVVGILCVLPLHRLLTVERNGPAGADALARADASWSVSLWGGALVALVGVLAAFLARGRNPAPSGRLLEKLKAAVDRVTTLDTRAFALGVALLAATLSALVAVLVYDRLLVSVDEMAQVIHARYLAAGMLAAQLPAAFDAWAIPNMLVTDAGWTSQYPPGHPLVWAAFVLVGLRWAAGPMLLALMVGLLAASFDRLLPAERRLDGRVAALLVALAPFVMSLSATTPSHLTAGAAGAAALYAALRASDGSRAWAAGAGVAMGLMVLARPWTGLVLGPTLTLGVWLQRGGTSLTARMLGPWVVGGLPCAALLFGYDAALFGSPLTLGYEASYGPAHGLGLHADPWSYPYGLREALAYSSADLMQLGVGLFDSPISIVLLASVYLAAVRALPSGVGIVATWALLPVAANALYWFHAPRMLFEAVPAWILLAVLAVSQAYRASGFGVRMGIVASAAATLLFHTPMAIAGMRARVWTDETLSRIVVPDVGAERALVFVHAPWDERIAATLQAAGMRGDSIQPVLRRNDSCTLHRYATARLSGARGPALPSVDLEQTPAEAVGSQALLLQGGTRVRVSNVAWPPRCAREAAADRFGSIALAPLLWQGDLPGLERGRPMFVRDLGPERNQAVVAAFPDRRPYVWGYEELRGAPVLIPYERAMSSLWSEGVR